MLYLLKTLIRIKRNAKEGLLKKNFLGSKEMKERRRKERTKGRKEEKRKRERNFAYMRRKTFSFHHEVTWQRA